MKSMVTIPFRVDVDLSGSTQESSKPTSSTFSSTTTTPTTKATSPPSDNTFPSAKPSATDASKTTSATISLSRASLGGIIAGIIATTLIVSILLLVMLRHRKGISLLKKFRHNRRDNTPTQATTHITSFDPLPPYTPEIDSSGPAQRTIAARATKGRRLQVNELLRRVGVFRTEIRQHGSSSVITLQPTESPMRVRAAAATPDRRIMKQITALRAQIHHWEEQLTSHN